MKHHITLLLTTLFLIPILIGCKEKTIIEKETEPTNNTEIVDVSAEKVTFFIESDKATEYAYILGESTLENITAEALFLKATEEGNKGEFKPEQSNGKVKVEITEKERRNKEYKLYTAVKKEKYSDVALVEFNTSFDYTEPITVENIEPRSFTYHIKREQGWNSYKHCVVRKVDYIAVRNMLAGLVDVTPASYNESFGHIESQDITVDLEKYFKDGDSEAQTWGIYPDACYMIIASPVDEQGRVIGGISNVKEFNTAKAPESEGKIAIEITAVSSVSASIRFTPDAQINRRKTVFHASRTRTGRHQTFPFTSGTWDSTSSCGHRESLWRRRCRRRDTASARRFSASGRTCLPSRPRCGSHAPSCRPT